MWGSNPRIPEPQSGVLTTSPIPPWTKIVYQITCKIASTCCIILFMKKLYSENKDYILNMFLVFGTSAFLYFIIKQFIPSYHLITLTVDDKIPLIPFFIIFYSIWYPYLFVVFYFIFQKDKDKFKSLIKKYILCAVIADLCFVIYPTMVSRPEVNGFNSLVSLMLYITYISDIPVNCFPSLHCTFALLVMYAVTFDKNMNKVFRILVGIISPLICLSTIFVKQHSIIDVVGALFLSCIVYVDFKKKNRR